MKVLIHAILWLGLSLLPHQALAGIPLAERYFEDTTSALTANDVAARLESFPWSPVVTPKASFGFSRSRFWFRFRIPEEKLRQNPNNALMLEIPNGYIEKIAFYEVIEGKVIRESVTGMGVPLSKRDAGVLSVGWPVFRLPGPREPTADYLISIEGRLPLSLPIVLMEAPEYSYHNWSGMLFFGAFMGCLALAAVFNGFLGVSLRNKLYLNYSLFVFSIFLMCAATDGLTVQLLWPEWPWWALRELHVMGGLTLFFYVLFVREFVESRRVSPRLDWILLALVAVSSLRSFVVIFWLDQNLLIVGQIAVVLSNFVVLGIGVQALRKGVRSARFFLLSSAVFNFAMILYSLQECNLIWVGPILYRAPHFGIAFEVCLLSLALADRIRGVKMELSAQKSAMVQAEKLSALGRMAGEIAHEINNPLAVIHGNAVLIKKTELIPQIREYAETIEATANRISKVVKGMRALARDSRQDPFQPTSLNSIIQDTLTLCLNQARDPVVKVDVEQPSGDLTLRCRSSEISQVLVNLLSNSLDAVSGMESPWVRIDIIRRSGVVEVSVTDSGRGVPKGIRSRIQEPFFTTKEAGKGLGLGLSISRTIVEQHGGRLWLDESSKNTRFAFTVPIAES